MHLYQLIKKCRFIWVVFSMLSLSAHAEGNLPPILDYYPVCQYKILNTVTVKERIQKKGVYGDAIAQVQKSPIPTKTKKILKTLQIKAKKQNADALVLILRQLKAGTGSRKKGTKTLSYRAEFIGQCNDLSADKTRPAKIDHLGQKKTVDWNNKISVGGTTRFVISNSSKSLRHPVIENNEVSFTNGGYGVKLGLSINQVKEILGDASVELAILKNELVLGYGRRHWFYFQSNKLVKIDTTSSLLTNDILNSIPIRDFFDDYSWKINGELPYLASLSKVVSVLGLNQSLSVNDELLLKRKGLLLRLKFDKRLGKSSENRRYRLVGFSLEKENYQIATLNTFEQFKNQFEVIEQAYIQLKSGTMVDYSKLSESLGDAVGRISLAGGKILMMYNSSLLVEITNSELSKIRLTEPFIIYKGKIPVSNEYWNINGFKQHKELTKLRQAFPEDAFELSGKVDFEYDLFLTSLLFAEQGGQQLLYQFDIELW